MATPIKLPDLGTTVDEVKLLSWLKQEGDPVTVGQPLCEIETDKANGELESAASGVVLRHVVRAGEMVKKGAVIAYIGQAGEVAPESDKPKVKPLEGNQLAVARRVAQSHREIVPFSLTSRVDMTAACAFRDRLQKELSRTISLDTIFIYAAARVVRQFPHFRGHVAGDEVVMREAIHIAFAVGFRDALYLLVVRQADRKSPGEIEDDVHRLVARAAARKATVEDLTGACFAVSNLGMYPIESFNVVVPPLQSAAMAVGAIQDAVVVREGKIVTVPLASFTLTADHRIINGREGAQFLARLKQVMETLRDSGTSSQNMYEDRHQE